MVRRHTAVPFHTQSSHLLRISRAHIMCFLCAVLLLYRTQQVVAMVRKNYVSSAPASSAQACARGLDALQYLEWLYTSTQVETVTSSANVVRLPSLSPDIQAAYIEALNSVLCDGKTLLITLPTVWKVSSGMSMGAGAICLITAALCFCCIGYTAAFRHHPVIRSSSPHFLSMSLFGVAVLLAGTYVMVQPPTYATCTTMAWLWSLGFSLTFSPLFAKTWRIYRIFGRKKLSVVKISNRKLAVMVGAILTLDLVLLSVWQALSPLQPYITTIYTGSNPVVQNDYSQCGVDGDGRSMLALVAVSKGVLLLFGSLMAFTTRKVTSTFNESSGIALAIYNVLFSLGIIAPIILVIHAIGDVLVLLLLFLGLWVSCFTAAILYVPKLLHIHGANAQQGAGADMSKVSSSGQYSFLSMAQMSTVPVVMAYIAALKTHLNTAEKRLSDLKSKQGGGGKGGVDHSTASTVNNTPLQQNRRPTLSANQSDSNTPQTSHRRFLSSDAAAAALPKHDSSEADVLNVPPPQQPHSSPLQKQRSTIVTQASPLLREKRSVGRSSRADGGGEVSGSIGGGSMMLGDRMRSSSSASSDGSESRNEDVEEEGASTAALVGTVRESSQLGQ